jgi:bacterioferritin (cytochrome b1)
MTLRCKAHAERVSRLLNEVLATEILCVLRYMRQYFTAVEIRSRQVKAKFLQYVTMGTIGSMRHAVCKSSNDTVPALITLDSGG